MIQRLPTCVVGLAMAGLIANSGRDAAPRSEATNLAPFAAPATSFVSGHETLDAINDGYEPQGVGDHRHGAYGNFPQTGTQWVEYQWSRPILTRSIDVYWWADGRGIRLPVACRLSYWDGSRWMSARDTAGLGVAGGRYNTTTFAELTTTRLRLEFDSQPKFCTGVLEWKVYASGESPKFGPRVEAGPDRVVVLPAKTYLRGTVRGPQQSLAWRKAEGPGQVTFADPHAPQTTAQFSAPGDYVLELSAANADIATTDRLRVQVAGPAPRTPLRPLATSSYAVDSPFWSKRLKQQIVHWIPHCIAELSKPDLKEGGFQNFLEAGAKNSGRPHKPHVGPPWANAYTLNTVEAICLALLLDPQGDAELLAAQAALRTRLDQWIPLILRAQEPDGYLQTRFTLGVPADRGAAPPRWTRVGDHEGYVAGYFLDAAVAHFWLTAGRDRRMYNAAKRLADCWDAHIGPPPKQSWYDGHEEIEQALVRFGRVVNEVERAGKGEKYIRLAKYLLDCRDKGNPYDQSHVPVVQQYEALGHAVRATYCYSAIAEVACETGDPEYHSAAKSLWNSVVNRKYYVTGGVGAMAQDEAFGREFELPHGAYNESCAACGSLFLQHKMNLAHGDARYADVLEDTLYNAILGSVDLPARNFTYTNPLDQRHSRYAWHGCPCCVGNIPRTLLMLPTWMYARAGDDLFVNLYLGSTVRVGPELTVTQRTDYPWKGAVDLIVQPVQPKSFALHVRVPNRNTSALYRATPEVSGLTSLQVNGQPVAQELRDGYAIIRRQWKSGDTVRLELPLCVQRVRADQRIVADRGRVALRYGPLIYNIESVDQNLDGLLRPTAELTTHWEPNLLDGLVVIRGAFADATPLHAIPNYARNNRGGRSIVWIAEQQQARASH